MPTPSRSPDSEPPGAPSPLNADTFLKNVLRSSLLTRDELQAAVIDVAPELRTDSRALADHLIRKGKLSRFQANKLLKGTTKGLIIADYQILAPLGQGGMGTVYMARDQRNRQLVALKVLPPRRHRDKERTLTRFQREMELCRRVQHPHIALTYATGVFNDIYYIAMEYIPGKSLYRLVMDGGPLDPPRLAHLGLEVASGLEHAHRQGLIHRDIKPSNILVTPHNHAKVLDLGLALVAGETGEAAILGGQGYIVGTMDYISPEQTYDASQVDVRADVYGLGCTFFFALTGQSPFPGGTSVEKIQKHRHDLPPPLSQLRPDVPMDFADVIHRMMAKDPALRLPSAQAVVEALRPWALTQHLQPLDRPDDAEFRRAVEALQKTEAPPDLLQTELPSIDDSQDVALEPETLVSSLRSSETPFHQERRRQAEWFWLALIGGLVLSAIFVVVALAACLLSWLFL